MELSTDIIKSFENKQVTMATFLDLSKAFDTIDHNILITKLKLYGIRGTALNWFVSDLTNRKHFIQFKSCHPKNHNHRRTTGQRAWALTCYNIFQ